MEEASVAIEQRLGIIFDRLQCQFLGAFLVRPVITNHPKYSDGLRVFLFPFKQRWDTHVHQLQIVDFKQVPGCTPAGDVTQVSKASSNPL